MTAADQARDAAAYAGMLRGLMPRGPAWAMAEGSRMASLLDGLAMELARIDDRAVALREEADPRTALELLPDWERVAALPDACTGVPDNAGERQAALHYKLTRPGAQNAAAYVEIAARVGYQIDIEEHRPMRAGFRAGARCKSLDWTFAWTVRVWPFDGWLEEADFVAVFRAGAGRAGDRLRGFGALNLECLIRRAAPAHTTVLFAYDVEPSPALWVDFTE